MSCEEGLHVSLIVCVVEPGGKLGCDDQQVESSLAQTSGQPNIIFLFTDNQDPRSLNTMPNVKSLLVNRGKTFPNATFAQPLCCPSRATMLRGQYPHNTGILDNGGDDGGAQTFRRLGRDRSTYATWLDKSGYKTGYFGKYMNGYENEKYVPPGWDRWIAADTGSGRAVEGRAAGRGQESLPVTSRLAGLQSGENQ
jgi:N-acetylglucosamine-6-sulfatase